MKVLLRYYFKSNIYVGRPNRFVVTLDLNGESVLAHLQILVACGSSLFTGVTMYIVPSRQAGCEDEIRVVGIERRWRCYRLDTNYSNDVAQHLIENKCIPGWEE